MLLVDWVAECCLHGHLKPLDTKPASSLAGGSHACWAQQQGERWWGARCPGERGPELSYTFSSEFTEHGFLRALLPHRTG